MAAALAGEPHPDIGPQLRATLAFLERLTLLPAEIGTDDVDAVIATGVTPSALRDAIEVAAAFNVIDRIADTLDFAKQTPGSLAASTEHLVRRGYARRG